MIIVNFATHHIKDKQGYLILLTQPEKIMKKAHKAILAKIVAKPEHVTDVQNLLTSALHLANQEAETTTWFSFKLNETTFGIFDTFANDHGRDAHLNGEIARALLSKADEWLSVVPEILKADVLAAKLV